MFESDQFIAFYVLCLGRDRHVSKVKDLSEEGLPSGPLDHVVFREQEKAESEGHQEDQLQQVHPDCVQDNLEERRLRGSNLRLALLC